MDKQSTINVRLPGQLKASGTSVLDHNGITPTELVKSVYRYMERHQRIPDCLDVAPGDEEPVFTRRRALLRRAAGTLALPDDFDPKRDRADRISEKHGDLL